VVGALVVAVAAATATENQVVDVEALLIFAGGEHMKGLCVGFGVRL
jgi:hypothetical protein